MGKCQGQFCVPWGFYLIDISDIPWVTEVLVLKSLYICPFWATKPMKSYTLDDIWALANL